LPSPAAAAYEAARIVGEMVGDIASAPGAALVAAAAAGAAIEVTRARAAAAPAADRSGQSLPSARDGRAASHPGRAASHPGRDELADEFDDGLDPVAIAAAAISRLRDRARSDLAELRV